MTLAKLTTRGQTQKITTQPLNNNSNVVGTTNVTILTVAAGKKIEIIEISNRAVSFGANTTMDIIIGGRRLRRATVADANLVDIPQGRNQVLTAAQTIVLAGDNAANNGSMDYMISYRETPA